MYSNSICYVKISVDNLRSSKYLIHARCFKIQAKSKIKDVRVDSELDIACLVF